MTSANPQRSGVTFQCAAGAYTNNMTKSVSSLVILLLCGHCQVKETSASLNLACWISPWIIVECQRTKQLSWKSLAPSLWHYEKCFFKLCWSCCGNISVWLFVIYNLIIYQEKKNVSPNTKWAQRCEIYCQQMIVLVCCLRDKWHTFKNL